MNMKKNFSFIDVPTADKDDARRRRLLNIILVAFGGLTAVAVIISLFFLIGELGHLGKGGNTLSYLSVNLILLLGFFCLFLINRYGSGWVASSIFLVFLTIVLCFSDTPQEVSGGR